MTDAPAVAALPTFRHVHDDGRVVASHPPMSTDLSSTEKYYWSSMSTTSMFRPDGKRMVFHNHIFKAVLKADQQVLDNEIELGHAYVRAATPAEVHNFQMMEDPEKTIRAQVEAELRNDPVIRARIEAEIRAEMETQVTGKTTSTDIPAEDPIHINQSAARLAGVDSASTAATVVSKGETASVLSVGTPRLGGIASTASIASIAARSGS